jgi:omega-6 fatty acid desaturase (delta-12 desaturase)
MIDLNVFASIKNEPNHDIDTCRLQHTDVDVPHFSGADHTYVRGALHTIDRPYDKLDPWGAIDFLHHKIGTTHVAHHFDSSIPHYKAQAATDAIKEAYPQFYLYEPTPIPQALWRVCKGCTSVMKKGDRWVWNNNGVEDQREIDRRVLQCTALLCTKS